MDAVTTEFKNLLQKKLNSNLKSLILFGSRARGDFNEGSDYDFLLVVDKKTRQINDQVIDICAEMIDMFSVLVGCTVCDEKEWDSKKKFPIGLNILKEGIAL